MEIVLRKEYSGGFHPVNFERDLKWRGWKDEDFYPKQGEDFRKFCDKMRSNADVLDVVKECGPHSGYTIIEVPDGIDFRVVDYDGFETAFFAYNNKIYDDRELDALLHPWEHENRTEGKERVLVIERRSEGREHDSEDEPER